MKKLNLIFAVLISTSFTGCTSFGDKWAKSASDAFLEYSGASPSSNTGSPNVNTSAPNTNTSAAAEWGANSYGNTSGSISLSGPDTSMVGTQLNTGYVGTSLAAGSQPDYIIIVDRSSTVSFKKPNILIPNIADPHNGFALVITDVDKGYGIKAISMSIMVNGHKYDYLCHTKNSEISVNCGTNSIVLDIRNQTVTLDHAKVVNTDTNSILGLNGTLSW